MNYREAYLWGCDKLDDARVEEYQLDARLLLEYVCNTDRNTLLAHPDRELSGREIDSYQEAIGRRAERIPLQHITGVQEFMGLEFDVNSHVLIPRQDTECLVEEVLRHLTDGSRILDLCTGTGCILLSILSYSNDCTGIGVDLSKEALEVAGRNYEKLSLLPRPVPWTGESAKWVCSDLFEKVELEKFDVIVSNPPYIATKEILNLMEEVRCHEPAMALDGREDGLYFYRRIVKEAGEFLRKEGMLFFEIGYDQAKAVSELMKDAGFKEVNVVKDFAGHDRVVYGSMI